MTIDFSTFEEIELLEHYNIVYVLHFIQENKTPIPFYVGETSRPFGRIADYLSAQFSASTDFKVGEAVKYLRKLEIRVVFKFKVANDKRNEERFIIQTLKKHNFQLLNDLEGYNYKNADIEYERQKIQKFIDQILEKPS